MSETSCDINFCSSFLLHIVLPLTSIFCIFATGLVLFAKSIENRFRFQSLNFAPGDDVGINLHLRAMIAVLSSLRPQMALKIQKICALMKYINLIFKEA